MVLCCFAYSWYFSLFLTLPSLLSVFCDIWHSNAEPNKTVVSKLVLPFPLCLFLIAIHSSCRTFSFQGLRLDEALRLYLEAFRLPGEAPVIQRLLEAFTEHWRVCTWWAESSNTMLDMTDQTACRSLLCPAGSSCCFVGDSSGM